MKKLLKTLIPCICGVSMLFTPMVSNAAEQSDDVMREINNTYSGVSDISTETSEEDNLSGAGGTGYLDDKYITDPENDTIIMNNALGDNASYDNYDKDVTVTIRTMIEPGFDKAKYIGGVSAEFWSIDGKYGMTYEADISSEKLWNAVTDGTWEASDYYYLPQGSWQFKMYKLQAYQSKDSEIVCYQNEIKDAKTGESYTICCLLGEPEWVENKKDTAIPEAYVNMGNVLLEDSVMKQRQDDLDMMRDHYGLLMAENASDTDYFLNTLLTSNDKVRIYSPSHPDDIYSLSGKYYKVYAKWEWKPESGADKKTKYLRSEFDKAVPEGTKDSVTNLDKEFVQFCNDNRIDMSTGEQSDKDVTSTNDSYTNDADKIVTNDKKQYKTIDAEKDKTGKDYIIMTIIVSGLIILVILAIKHKIDKGSISDE